MAVRFKHAKPGYKYVLTDLGEDEPRIRAKYNQADPSTINRRYNHSVPASWISKGYVEEVKEED